MPLPALGSETQPVEDQATVFEPGGAELRRAWAGEEELLDLGLVEVAVLRQRCEDCHVSGGQLPEQEIPIGPVEGLFGCLRGFANEVEMSLVCEDSPGSDLALLEIG